MTDPETTEHDCDDKPKLTADEWAYVEAVTGEGDD